jgi:hypothetical protein
VACRKCSCVSLTGLLRNTAYNAILNHPSYSTTLRPLMCIVQSQSTNSRPLSSRTLAARKKHSKTTGTTRSTQGWSTGEQIRNRGRSRERDRDQGRAGTMDCGPGRGCGTWRENTPSRLQTTPCIVLYVLSAPSNWPAQTWSSVTYNGRHEPRTFDKEPLIKPVRPAKPLTFIK